MSLPPPPRAIEVPVAPPELLQAGMSQLVACPSPIVTAIDVKDGPVLAMLPQHTPPPSGLALVGLGTGQPGTWGFTADDDEDVDDGVG